MPQEVEFVTLSDTLAESALKEATSASLAATTSILLAILIIVAFIANVLLLATIFSSYKMRNCILYIMFGLAGIMNIVDISMIIFISVLYIANTAWIFGGALCRINAMFQQFIFLKILFLIVVMAIERVLSSLNVRKGHAMGFYFLMLSTCFTIVCLAFSIPILFSNFPVKLYRYRYLCGIGSVSPLAYNIIEVLVYVVLLTMLLVSFGFILKKGYEPRSLPIKPQDYEAFIMETRKIQENLNLGKLVMYITISYVILQGPYIIMTFVVQIKNSKEVLDGGNEYEIPQDAETLITWLRFFHPLIMPLIIFASCHDIWTKLANLICCRRSTFGGPGNWIYDSSTRPKSSTPIVSDNVITLVATSGGLQLHVTEGSKMYQDQQTAKEQQHRQIPDIPYDGNTAMYKKVEHVPITPNAVNQFLQ